MIEQAKFTYSPLGKTLNDKQKQLRINAKSKKKKIMEDHLKIMENYWLNLINLLKRILMSTATVYHLKNKKNI